MALTGSTTTVARKAASAARRLPRGASMLAQMAPSELADPAVMARLSNLGVIPPGGQGLSGFVNGGPLAGQFVRPLEQMALPASTGVAGALTPITNVAQSATGAAESAAARAASQAAQSVTVPSQYILDTASMPVAAGETAATTKAGRIGGLLSWNPTLASRTAALGEGAAPLATGALAPGSLGRAGAYGLGGYLGANVLHGIVGERNGTWDDAAEGALKGGGIGAGIGSMIAPGPGTVIGGVLGGIGGAIWGGITGNDSPQKERDKYLAQQTDPSNEKSLVSLMGKYGLSTDAQHQLLLQIEAIGPTLGSRDEAKALVQQVMGNLPTLIEQDKVQQAQASRAAAMQAYLLPMMRDSQNQTTQFMQQQATLMNDAASRMPASIADVYRTHAANLMSTHTRAYQAQLAQMMLAPQLYQQSAQYGLANPITGAAATTPTTTSAAYSPTG